LLLALAAVPAATQAATITVTGSGDAIAVDGLVTLREAITSANNNANVNADVVAIGTYGADTISFNIPGTGVHTISPTSALPQITDPVIIDGYTQPGASQNALASGDNAVLLIELNGANVADTNGLNISTGNSTVRGLVINGFLRNGNNGQGIVLAGGDGNQIEGNFIGINPGGTAAVPNGGHGIDVLSGNNHVIGGTAPAARNIISGNAFTGIRVNSLTGILIQGNFIGTGRDGSTPLGNGGNGVGFEFASAGSNNLIGGMAAGAGNVIANNGANGVALDEGITNTPILANSIFVNGALGIDLTHSGTPGGVTLNDAGDADTGANNLQNFPVLESVSDSGGMTHITGRLNSVASTTYRIEFFANDTINPTGYGEGQIFLGFKNVTTNGSGNVSFSQSFSQIGVGQRVTATATDPNGNTSEFSGAIGQLLNISTRMEVLTGNSVLIGGFIIGGSGNKVVLLRALGPTLTQFGVNGVLADPMLELHDGSGALITSNDNWKDTQQAAISATGKAPPNDLESAILHTFTPGNYTAIVRGKNNTTGIGLVEAYDIDEAITTTLTNISTRGFVDTGQNVMIGGFISGNGIVRVIVRALGPTLSQFGVPNVLADPTLDVRDAQGTSLATNDNWADTQQAEIQASGFAPPNANESAIIIVRPAGNTTAIVSGKNNTTGNALVECYILPP